jgi:amino acid transporter
MLSWQAGTASSSFLTGTLIQSLIKLNDPDSEPKRWQGSLLAFAMVLVLYISNTWGAKSMPIVNNCLLVVHVFGFFIVIIVLWIMAPRNSAEKVFTEFMNGGGYASMTVTVMVGQISAIYGFTCQYTKRPACNFANGYHFRF